MDVSQTVIAAAIPIIFFGVQLKTIQSCDRNALPLVWLLTVNIIASIAGLTLITIGASRVLDEHVIEASLLYILALVLQVDQLWPCTAIEETKQAWCAYLCSWAAMVAYSILDIIKLTTRTYDSPFELVCRATTTSIQFCFTLALFIVFNLPRHIRLDDNVEATPGHTSTKSRSQLSNLQTSVSAEIKEAGGVWLWIKMFRIFKDWIWPCGLPLLWLRIVAAILLLLSDTLLKLYSPRVLGAYLDSVGQAFKMGEPREVWWHLAMMVIANFAGTSSGLLALFRLQWGKIQQHRSEVAQTYIYKHVMGHEASFHDTADPTDIHTATALGLNVNNALDFLTIEVVPRLFILVGTPLALLSQYGLQITLVGGFVASLNTIIMRRRIRIVLPLSDTAISARLETDRRQQKGLRSWRTVVIKGMVDHEIRAYSDCVVAERRLSWKSSVIAYISSLASNIPVSLGYYFAMVLVILRALRTGNIGAVVAFESYWRLLQGSLIFFMHIPERILRDLYKADRLRRLLEIKPKMAYGLEDLQISMGFVELKKVTFSYTETGHSPVFKNLSLVIQPGKTTALVGPSGVGKSTVLDLIVRLYDTNEGSVEIDGQDVKTLAKGALAKDIAYMGQTTHLFNDTIMNNIRYGWPQATVSEVHEAAKRAGIHTDIMAMEMQYETMLGPDGGKISGGQKQRVALASALLRKPKVLLLDEPTSALDIDSEALIKESIKTDFGHMTCILTTHRLSLTQNADQIVVLRKTREGCGEIAEIGTHTELLKLGGSYARLWQKQDKNI